MELSVVLGIVGVCVSFCLLIFLIMKGVNIFLTTFITTFIVAALGGLNLFDALKGDYLTGFVGFFKAYFLIFLTGTLMGKAMDVTGAARAIAKLIINGLGKNWAFVSVPLACGILCYGGVSAFVCAFAVFPIALAVFQQADLPRRYIPGALCFGCSTFAMIAPGAPQIHNMIPSQTFHTDFMAGTINGFLACGFMLMAGMAFLYFSLKARRATGEGFVAKTGDDLSAADAPTPNGWLALIPLALTIFLVNFKTGGKNICPVEIGVFAGALATVVMFHQYLSPARLPAYFGEGCQTAIFAIANTCAVVGFGTVVAHSNCFQTIIQAMTHIPGPPLVGVLVGTNVIAGICGSASGGLGIACPLLGPAYLAQGVAPAVMHRVMALASSALDSLPHNGYIVTVTNGLCRETHKDSYGLTFWLTVAIPFVGAALGVALFSLFPNWP